MKIDKIKFSEIVPSDYNPRIMTKEEHNQLKNNLEKFGLVDPIIINLKNMHIIGGHQRHNVLREKYGDDVDFKDPELNIIKLGDIGWVFEDTNLKIKDENHEKALNLALNKISGEWDYGKLSFVLDDLNKVHFDMDLTGFNEFEVKSFIIPKDLVPNMDDIKLRSEQSDTVEETRGTTDIIEPEDHESFNEHEEYDDKQEETLSPEHSGEGTIDGGGDETLVSSDEIQKITKYRCPKCGYEW